MNEPSAERANARVVRSEGFDLARKYFHPPFSYDEFGSAIVDRDGHKMLDVRGWGYLTGRGGGRALHDATAEKIQDAIGRKTAELLNASWSNG